MNIVASKMISRKYLNVLLITRYLFGISQAQNDDDLVITLINPEGRIQGKELVSTNNNSFYAYQGIPYASPPTGSNRFAQPKNPEGWSGIRDATKPREACVQFLHGTSSSKSSAFLVEPESEDCLFVNVYTPIKPGTENVILPVLVWIHGGSFVVGSGSIDSFGPYLFMDHEIVVVTMNYRLGAFGFLTTQDDAIPGNLALKDQNFALRWIAQNIHLFGGDANKVTIVGESAGSASVGLHLVGRKDGLFRGAVQQSGSSVCIWAYTEYARNYAFDLGRLVKPSFTSNDSQDLLTLLQNVSTNDFVAAAKNVQSREGNLGIPSDLIWTAVIEDENEDAFLTKPMLQSFLLGDYNVVPTLLGYNSEESLYFIARALSQVAVKAGEADRNPNSIVNPKIHMTAENRNIAATQLRPVYTNATFETDLFAFVKLLSDAVFKKGVIKQAKISSAYAPTYLYQFSFQSNASRQILQIINQLIPGVVGVGHGLDLEFMWNSPDNFATILSDPVAGRISQQFVKLWSNFVKYQNPAPERDELLDNIEWPTVNQDSLQYLDIDVKLQVVSNPVRYLEVEEITDQYYEKPAIVY